MTLTFGSLFAGIGGFDLGFERAGLVCRWQVEIDEYRRRILAKHWPDVPRYGDVKDVGREQLEPVDVICGGFPCQPHSIAGERRGAADDRNLWPEHRRIIEELKPTWAVIENVLGIRGTILSQVLSEMGYMGYESIVLIIPACAFDARHIRQRIFIISWRNSSDKGRDSLPVDGASVRDGILPEWGHGRYKVVQHGDRMLPDRVDQTNLFLADASSPRLQTSQSTDTLGKVRNNSRGAITECCSWTIEPGVGRVADGVPNRVDRIAALGDAVIPQAAEWLGQRIMMAEGLR